MLKQIEEILKRKTSNEAKIKALNEIQHEIDTAKDIIAGKYKYCGECRDYYLTKSFLTEHETIPTRICTYDDPINSGGNEYADGYADIVFEVCPKGHRHEISRKERRK